MLMSRATDVEGKTQAAAHDGNFGSYGIHHTVGIEITVN